MLLISFTRLYLVQKRPDTPWDRLWLNAKVRSKFLHHCLSHILHNDIFLFVKLPDIG